MILNIIQPFGWICIIIAWGRKSQNNPSDLNMVSINTPREKMEEFALTQYKVSNITYFSQKR
jgi:hypothetical protein